MITTIVFDHNDGNSTDYYYDKLGNRTNVTNGSPVGYNHNSLNQYTSVGGTPLIYYDNGNLDNDGTTYKYYYDCENRLIDVNNQSNQRVASYRYDYLGRRIRKTVGATVTTYCYDGDQVIAEYNGSGTLLRKYIYGPGIDEPICMITISGETETKYYYHFDGLGSVIALSNTNGTIIERYSYDAFGLPNTTSNVGNPYFFTGRNYDSETGLYCYCARYYSPEIGRFMQTDPIGYVDRMSLYTYAENNPQNLKDPLGLICCSECQTNFNRQRRQLLNDLGSCLGGCGTVISPGAVVCIIACAFTGPYFPACATVCLGVDAGAFIHCAGACVHAYHLYMDTSINAYNNCMAHCE